MRLNLLSISVTFADGFLGVFVDIGGRKMKNEKCKIVESAFGG